MNFEFYPSCDMSEEEPNKPSFMSEPEEQNEQLCEYCGWCSAFVASHVEHSMHYDGGCKHIDALYNIFHDDDGELVWTLKQVVFADQ